MKRTHPVRLLAVCVAGLILAAGLAWRVADSPQIRTVTIATQSVEVELADTQDERVKGLSGRSSLADGHGLLFAFDSDEQHGIWMKDMNFTIDVLWLDAKGRVVHLVDDMSPESYPTIYRSDEPARYVLELNSEAIETYKVDEGAIVQGLAGEMVY